MKVVGDDSKLKKMGFKIFLLSAVGMEGQNLGYGPCSILELAFQPRQPYFQARVPTASGTPVLRDFRAFAPKQRPPDQQKRHPNLPKSERVEATYLQRSYGGLISRSTVDKLSGLTHLV
jgi:hypothetical protein